uniref:Uncharacterized protein n=2 Tax=Lotharella oceanica TaxID=641309 RepID=A0A7S2XDS3_9EUKA|mmetsp:Transcript_30273/g.56549  ORF Transcript_30273/g.56549 Transcript_30273/m.56549 type:complete len:123 (+) Transcript_30273:274-642(+)
MVTQEKGTIDVEFYLTFPQRVYKMATDQNPDTIYQDLHERLVWERNFALRELSADHRWPKTESSSADEASPSLERLLECLLERVDQWIEGKGTRRRVSALMVLFLFGMITARCQAGRKAKAD